MKVWRVDEGVCDATLRVHQDYVRCLAYAPERNMFASAGFDRKIHVWDLASISSASSPSMPANLHGNFQVYFHLVYMEMPITVTLTVSGHLL